MPILPVLLVLRVGLLTAVLLMATSARADDRALLPLPPPVALAWQPYDVSVIDDCATSTQPVCDLLQTTQSQLKGDDEYLVAKINPVLQRLHWGRIFTIRYQLEGLLARADMVALTNDATRQHVVVRVRADRVALNGHRHVYTLLMVVRVDEVLAYAVPEGRQYASTAAVEPVWLPWFTGYDLTADPD